MNSPIGGIPGNKLVAGADGHRLGSGAPVSQWAHIYELITWLMINGMRRYCLRIISPPAVGTLCSTWNVGPENVPVMGSQDR